MSDQELVEILDEAGNKTGEVTTRRKAHERELLHGSAFVWIINSRKEALMQLRAPDKDGFPSRWDVSAAGHIEAGSSPLQTAVREIEEELGLEVSEDQLKYLGLCRDEFLLTSGKKHREFAYVYIMEADVVLDKLVIQETELSDLKWVPISALEQKLSQDGWDKTYAGRNVCIYNFVVKFTE